MKLSLVQCEPSAEGFEASLRSFDELLGTGTGADIYILPEMFATGQCMNPVNAAQRMDGPVVSWMLRTASRLNAAVTGSLAVEEGGKYYNRMCFALPDGSVVTYDKRHLFTYSGEGEHYTAGEERVITEFRGVRILLQVCYDLRFPVFSRNRDDYDLAIYVANWPLKRQNSWDVFLRARAMENQCYVAGVNRMGDDEYGHYTGHTALVGAYGDTIAGAADDTAQVVTADIDMEKLMHFRTKFPVMQDADRF